MTRPVPLADHWRAYQCSAGIRTCGAIAAYTLQSAMMLIFFVDMDI